MKKGALAIDHGSKRTGFAAVDALRVAPTPLETVAGGNAETLEAMERLLTERDVTHVIVGYPLNMDGSKGGRAAEVDRFVERMRARFPAPRRHVLREQRQNLGMWVCRVDPV